MPKDTAQLYQERLNRYVTALHNGKPDKIPIRPFVAEFTGTYAGYDCQQLAHDYNNAFDAVLKCTADFDWDAAVANMVYCWTGLSLAQSVNYYAVPGVHIEKQFGFQYREPPEEKAFMLADEYDQLIADPTEFLYNVWLPRVCDDVPVPGQPSTYRQNVSLVTGSMAMLQYFMAFGPQIEAMRTQTGTVSAIAGILKAPLDILADKLRGYLGLCMDLANQPQKVLAACEALAPHLAHVALTSSDPTGTVPIGLWMHRGCVPFVSHENFNEIFWPTLRPIIESLWAAGRQTMFYAEGKWGEHLDAFAELPDHSILYHVDQDDIEHVHKKLGHKFCLSGGVPNYLLGIGTPQQVKDACKRAIDIAAGDGGYIMDASAIVQNDAKVENLRAMTDFTREYGVYPGGVSRDASQPCGLCHPGTDASGLPSTTDRKPGVCVPWEEKRKELPPITGDADLVKRIWENTDALGYTYIYQCLVSF